MINAAAFLDRTNLEREIAEGYIKRQWHSTLLLQLLNYTNKTQFEQRWNDETLNSRGLILDAEFNVMHRCFPKFFNLSQHDKSDELFSKPFTVTEKVDGSYGGLYISHDGPAIATRGSFVSDQAIKATEILRAKYLDWALDTGHLLDEISLMFEIVYPLNRIVVQYDIEDLILLGVIDNESGRDLVKPDLLKAYTRWPGPVVESYDADCNPHEVLENLGLVNDGSQEGVVLNFFDNGKNVRVKAKLSQYIILHSALTGLSNKSIWNHLSQGSNPEELYEILPDETYDWAKRVVNEFQDAYLQIYTEALENFCEIVSTIDLEDRASFAKLAKERENPHLLFKMLDNSALAPSIWKMLKPDRFTPYFNDPDDILSP